MVRVYHAITEDNWKEDEGTISAPIGRSLADRKMAVIEDGRQAVTHYRVRNALKSHLWSLSWRPEPSKYASPSHQRPIRDPVYGRRKQMFNLKGQALHALKLTLTHPRNNEIMTFHAPLPEYFEKLLELLRKK